LTQLRFYATRLVTSGLMVLGERDSGAGTNLKVGITHLAPEIFLSGPSTFLALLIHYISRFVSAFMMVTTVWSVSCLPFSTAAPLYPAICKSGGICRCAPMSYGVGDTGEGQYI